MKNFFKLIAIVVSTVIVASCGPKPGMMHEDADKILQNFDSRIARARVDGVLSKTHQDTWIDSLNDDEFYLLGMGNYTRTQLKNDFGVASLRYDTTLFHDRRIFAFFRKELDLKFHDIVDYYTGKYNREALLIGDPTHSFPNIFKVGGTEGVQVDFGVVPQIHRDIPVIVLDVVCRSADPDCDWDDRPGTEVGLGRKVNGPEEYRGVKGESQQKIWKNTFP